MLEFAGPLVSKRGFDPQYASVFDRYAASTRNLLGMFRFNFNTKFGKDKKSIKLRPATQNTQRVEISIRNATRRKRSGSGPLSFVQQKCNVLKLLTCIHLKPLFLCTKQLVGAENFLGIIRCSRKALIGLQDGQRHFQRNTEKQKRTKRDSRPNSYMTHLTLIRKLDKAVAVSSRRPWNPGKIR